MSAEGVKKTVAKKSSTTELLEAEIKGERVEVTIGEITFKVNPKAVTAGPPLRAMQTQGNPWPMFDLLVPDTELQDDLIATLPVDEELGTWDLEDFMDMLESIMAQATGKKA